MSPPDHHPSIQSPSNPSRSTKTRTRTRTSASPRAGPALSGTSSDPDQGKNGKLLQNSKKNRVIIPEVQYHPSISVKGKSPDRGPMKEVCVRPEGGATAQGPSPDSANTAANGDQQNGGMRRSARTRTQDAAREASKPKSATAPNKTTRKSSKCVMPPLDQSAGESGDARTRDGDENSPKTATTAGLPLDLPEPRPGSTLDQDLVKQVEVQTRGQSTNPDWFKFRTNRITASVAHSVANSRFANGQTTTPPASYVRAIIGESRRVQTRAMTWGIDHEQEAVLKYTKQQSATLGRALSVQDCGLFIDPVRPWLAASPDGIVTDARTGQSLRCLEVKCPFKHRGRSVMAAAQDDPQFCLEIVHQQGAPNQLSLKRTHSYFTQVQCQLAVTGLKMADFVVFTERDLVVVPVHFDPEFWDRTMDRLERFYTDAIVPALRGRSQGWRAEL